jgi:ribosomal protein S18 acetylase RimI-like enzyme
MNLAIRYSSSDSLDAQQFIDVLKRSGLAERRPVDNLATIEGMLRGSSILITAWQDELLVGVSRAISDFSYCTYLSDLAVDVAYQKQGIGKELIRLTHEAAGPTSSLILLSAPAATGYYPRIGMAPHNSCWTLPRRG